MCLRALLIQKDVKLSVNDDGCSSRLRALLIQKDVKHHDARRCDMLSLRALLIQKDVKLIKLTNTTAMV